MYNEKVKVDPTEFIKFYIGQNSVEWRNQMIVITHRQKFRREGRKISIILERKNSGETLLEF